MRLSARHPYDASPGAVWAMLIDPAFRAEVCRATGATSWDVSIDADNDGGTVTVTRVVPAQVTDAVKRLVGETVTVVQTETWGACGGDGVRRGDVRLDVVGQPASMTGTSTVSPAGPACVVDVDCDLRVRIPFLGGRLEREIAETVSAGLSREYEVGRRRLP